ncbi:MAG: Sec-independent protein translocase protein TatB [bacterium]
MFDIGIGEILILAVLGLLVFGPERLPKAAADAARMLRNVRSMASNARTDLADSAGVDFSDAKDAVNEISKFHPRRMMSGIFDDDDDDDVAPPAEAKGEAKPKPSSPAFDPDAT